MAPKQRTPPLAAAALSQNRRAPKPKPKLTWSQRSALLRAWLRKKFSAARPVLSIAWRLTAAGVAAGCVYGAYTAVERYARQSPKFAIVDIEVRGNQQLSSDAVKKAAGIALGQNVFFVGPEEAERRLLQLAWIESVRVRRILPGSYVIELHERHAVALLALSELYLVSDDGVAFKPLEAGDPFDLPLVTGIDINQVTQDRHASHVALVGAVALLHDYQDAGLSRREAISEVHLEADGGLSLYVGGDATHVRLGKAPFRAKLERLREVMTQLTNQRARAAYVLLDNQRRLDRVTVRLR